MQENLYDRNAFAGADQSALVTTLAGKLERALDRNAALVDDMGRFLHHTRAIQTFAAATDKDKRLQKDLFKRLSAEVNQQRTTLNEVLASDLKEVRTMINTGGGAYIGGSVKIENGNLIGRDSNMSPTQPARLNIPNRVDTSEPVRFPFSPHRHLQIMTEGGVYIAGDANVSGDFIGRDKDNERISQRRAAQAT